MESLPDFVKLAEAYGHVGIRITSLKDLKPKLEEAFAMKDRLVFIDIAVDPASTSIRCRSRMARCATCG
jgi:acetolactate synthase-1/2/3 large subunit